MSEEPRGRYVKRPIVVEAYRTTSERHIKTLEGTMMARVGDWIVTGIHGETDPVSPAIFEATYEPVTLTEAALIYRDKAALREFEGYLEHLEGILSTVEQFLRYRAEMNAAVQGWEVRFSPLTSSVLAGREYLGRLKGNLTYKKAP